jgi:transglutaminase-like putative cysteine protease
MDTYVDRPIQLRESARPSTPGRSYRFEIATVLCVGLIAATAWAVLAAGWVHGGGGAIVVAVTSVIEAALLAQARAPRIAAAIAAPFLGLAAIVPTTLAALPAVPGQTAGAVAGHYLRALFTGLASTQDWDFIVGLCAILFLCGYWLGWMVLREHRGVLAVIPIFSVLATNVVNARDPNPIALPETIAVVLAIAVVAAAYLGSLGDRWAVSRITALDGLGWRFGSSAATVAVVLTILALLLPPVSTTDISAKLFPHGLGFGSGAKGNGQTGGGGVDTIGFNASVTLGGSLVSHPLLAMTYETSTAASVYIRIADDTVFDKGSWTQGDGANSDAPNPSSAVEFPQGLLPRDLSRADGGIGNDESTIKTTLTLQPGATGQQPLAPFTGDPASVNLPGTAYGASNGPGADGLLTVDQVVLDQTIVVGTTIVTTGYVSTATEPQLRAAGINYPHWTSQYTALNDDASKGAETISRLAQQWVAGLSNRDPYDEALAIQQHLRNPAFFQYTLNPPQSPDSSVWPVVYFLTTSHRGYCQYFASAMGAMLRSLQIPTRLVSGYGPGTAETETGRTGLRPLEVTSSDAHSWVEAYFPGYGWIPFEPTPPSAQGDYLPFPRGQHAVSTPPPPPVATPRLGPTQKPGTGGSNPLVTPTPKPHAALPLAVVVSLSVLACIVLLLVAAILWMLLPRSLTGAWKRVETLGLISGVDRRSAETHRAFAARLGRARPPADSALSELANLTARAEFSASGASGSERAKALRTWRRILLQATLWPRQSPG